tara:strand:+ start:64 stop:234 length:171 start_codon:yes stop_codon:yes gene_type:complete
MMIYRCPKCNGELYEGECVSSYLPADEGEDCLVCDRCDESYTHDDEVMIEILGLDT